MQLATYRFAKGERGECTRGKGREFDITPEQA